MPCPCKCPHRCRVLAFYFGHCTSDSSLAIPIIFLSLPRQRRVLFNWYVITNDPLTMLLPLLTQHIFNVLISFYAGGALRFDFNAMEFLGFLYSCMKVAVSIVNAILALVDVLTGTTTFAAALGVGTSFGAMARRETSRKKRKKDSSFSSDLDHELYSLNVHGCPGGECCNACEECCNACEECCNACEKCCDVCDELCSICTGDPVHNHNQSSS